MTLEKSNFQNSFTVRFGSRSHHEMSYHGQACVTAKYSAPVSSVVKYRQLSLFGHVGQMNELAEASGVARNSQ